MVLLVQYKTFYVHSVAGWIAPTFSRASSYEKFPHFGSIYFIKYLFYWFICIFGLKFYQLRSWTAQFSFMYRYSVFYFSLCRTAWEARISYWPLFFISYLNNRWKILRKIWIILKAFKILVNIIFRFMHLEVSRWTLSHFRQSSVVVRPPFVSLIKFNFFIDISTDEIETNANRLNKLNVGD